MQNKFPLRVIVFGGLALLLGLAMGALVIFNSQPAQAPSTQASTQPRARSLQKGQPAPPFTLNTLAGQSVSLSDLRGKKVLVNFWASWCPPCLQELPDLKSAYAQLKGEGVVVEFVGIGFQDKAENLKRFVQEHQIDYVVLDDADGTVGDAYRVLAMPVSVFVDSAGMVQRVVLGTVTRDEILKTFSEMQ
jgi:peroxiredoxin